MWRGERRGVIGSVQFGGDVMSELIGIATALRIVRIATVLRAARLEDFVKAHAHR